MKDQLEKRLAELRFELDAAQRILADLKARQADTRNRILRTQGAIDVLEEELKKAGGRDEKRKEESKKPTPKKNTGQPVTSPPVATVPGSFVPTGGDKPAWHERNPAVDTHPASPDTDRNVMILKALRKHAPPDRKFTPPEIDELFAGVCEHDEVEESIEILVRDGMVTRIKTGIQVM